MLFIRIFLAAVLLVSAATAQSPREQLQQMVEQLQKTPNDNALRERIIKLGAQVKPAPAIPDEANRREGRGKFAFRSAKSNDDFLAAAVEFEEAAKAAPWVAGYYSDLCTIYEKVEKYADAKRNCELYLAGVTEPAQIADAKQRIAGIEFGIEKSNSPRARAAAMLALLTKQYASPARQVLICGVRLNQYWNCTDEEARGQNWVDSVAVNAVPKPGPGPVEYRIVGAAGDLIEVRLGGSWANGSRISARWIGCARPTGTDPNSMTWVGCADGKPVTYHERMMFTTANGLPQIEYRTCSRSESTKCRREKFILRQ